MKSTIHLIAALLLIPIIQMAQQAPDKGYKDIVLNPSFEHNKWKTQPMDIGYQFAAFECSFDGEDDNDGDGFSDIWGIPEWVAFEIKQGSSQSGCKRPNPWVSDSSLHRHDVAPKDATYKVSGTRDLPTVSTDYRYVRGHMCPFATAARISCDAAWNTCTMVNAVPQLQWQNNGIWKDLEKNCTDWADKHGSVWVVCGPVFFDKDPAVWLGQQKEVRTAVPDALFKVVIRESDNNTGVETISFVIPNVVPKDKELHEYVTSIEHIESLTGNRFLTSLSPNNQQTEKAKHGLPELPDGYSDMSSSQRRKAREERKAAFHETNKQLIASWFN